jgi:hypothetical protein
MSVAINEKTMTDITNQVKNIIDSNQNLTARELMIEMYIKNLPDKSPEQAELVIDSIYEIVKTQESGFEEAMEDLDGWIENKLDTVTADREIDERCNFYLNLIRSIAKIKVLSFEEYCEESGVDIKDLPTILVDGDVKLNPSAITQELEETLRNLTIKSLKDCNVLCGSVEGIIDELEAAETIIGLSETVMIADGNSADFKAVLSMFAYTAAKNGVFLDIPDTAGIDEITMGICVAVETQKLAVLQQNRTLAEKIVTAAMNVLSIIVIVEITLAAMMITHSLLSGIAILPSLAVVLGTVFAGYCVFIFAGTIIMLLSMVITKVITVAVNVVIAGLKAVSKFFKNNILPGIVQCLKDIGNFFVGLSEINTIEIFDNTVADLKL